jgi:hypothetical protein
MVSKIKRLPIEWEKIISWYISEKGLIIRTYRILKKLNNQKINDPMNKWTNKLNRAFSKEEVQIAENMKKCSPSLTIKEMRIKTTLRFHLTPVSTSRTQTITNVGEYAREKDHHTAGGM